MVVIEIDSDSDQSIDLKRNEEVQLRSVKAGLELLRTMNKRKFEEAKLMRSDERELFASLCHNVIFIDVEGDSF